MEVVTFEGKQLLVVRGDRPKAVPFYEYDGRTYIREGSSNRVLNSQERRHLDTQRNRDLHSGPWQCDGCGSTVRSGIPATMTTNIGVTYSYSHMSCGGEFWPLGVG
jgi:hypothetical protein